MARISLQDLRLAASARRAQTRGVDGFVAPGQFRASQPDLVDLAPLASGIAALSERRRARSIEEGEQFGRDEGKVAALRDALDQVSEGLDGEEALRAQRGALRSLAEQGIVPATANPAFLMGVARSEAERVAGQIRRDLASQVSAHATLTDENGDMVEPPDAMAAVQERFDAALESPLVRGSATARRVLDEYRPRLEAEFLGQVTDQRSQNIEGRRRALATDQLVQGFDDGKQVFPGLASLGGPEGGDAADLQAFQEGIKHLRDDQAIPNVGDLVLSALETRANQIAVDNPDELERLLLRVGGVEIAPGLPLERDTRFSGRLSALRTRADRENQEALRRESAAQATVESRLQSLYAGLVSNALAQGTENPTETALELLRQDPQAQSVLDAAGLTEIPSATLGLLRQTAAGVRADELRTRDVADTEFIQGLRRAQLDGETPDVLRQAALEAAQSGSISYRAYVEFASEIDQTSETLQLASQMPGYSRVRASLDRKARPEGLGEAATAELDELSAQVQERVTEGIAAAASGLTTADDRQRAAAEYLRGPEVAQMLSDYRSRRDALSGALTSAVDGVRAALDSGDPAAARAVLGAATGLSQEAQSNLRREIRTAERKAEAQFQTGQIRFTESQVLNTVTDLLTLEGIEESDADRVGRRAVGDFNRRLREQAKDLDVPIAQRPQALADLAEQVMDEVIKETFPDRDAAALDALDEGGVEAYRRYQQSQLDLDSFRQGTPKEQILGAQLPDVPPGTLKFLDSPRLAVPALQRLGGVTPDRAFGAAYRRLAEIPDDTQAALALSQVGAISVADVLRGSVTVRRPVQIRDFGGQDLRSESAQAQVAALRERGLEAEVRQGRVQVSRRLVVGQEQTHPTLSLFFRSEADLEIFLGAEAGTRTQFYEALGLQDPDLDKTDTRFAERQRQLLRRLDL